jgi:transposase-like protein
MDRQKAWNRIWLFGAAPLAAASIIGGGVVFAQSGPGTAPTPTQAQVDRQAATSDYIKALATNLNISEQTLRDAIKKTNLSFLDKAVTDGKITKEMADKIRADIESGQFGFFFGGPGGPGGPGGHGGPGGPGMDGRGHPGGHFAGPEFAAFLGVTQEQLRTELASGKTIAQVAEAHGKTRQQVSDFLIAARKAELARGVADGKMTQAQADEQLKMFTDNIATMLDSTGKPPMGGPGGAGRPVPGGPNRGPQTAPPAANGGTN